MHRDAPDPDEAEERFERTADDVVHVLAGARRTQPEPRRPDRDVALREVLPVEASTEHSVGAALRGERAIAHPWEEQGRDRVVVARDVALGDALIGPPHLIDVRDRHAADRRAVAYARRAHGRRYARPRAVHAHAVTSKGAGGKSSRQRSMRRARRSTSSFDV